MTEAIKDIDDDGVGKGSGWGRGRDSKGEVRKQAPKSTIKAPSL